MGIKVICGVVLLVALAVFVVVRRRRSKQANHGVSQATDTTNASAPKVEEPDAMKALFGDLADLMLKLRVSGVSQAVSDDVKEIVVDLTMLLPKFSERYGNSGLVFVLVQIGKNYLPNLLNPFSEMTTEMKVRNEPELRSSLATLKREIDKVQGILDRGEADRFETEAAFLRQRFLAESVEASEPNETQGLDPHQ